MDADARCQIEFQSLLASFSIPPSRPQRPYAHTARAAAAAKEAAMGDEEEYDFEYSDDDEAEPDVEVCACLGVWGVCVRSCPIDRSTPHLTQTHIHTHIKTD